MIIITITNLNDSLIEKSKKNRNSKGYTIGSVIKSRRNEIKQTLEEVSKDICCIGFLSKLERNKIDTVEDNPIVIKLCERLELNYEDIASTKTNDELILAMNEFAYYKYDLLKKRFESINKDLFLSQNVLIQCLYYLVYEDYTNLNILITKLDPIKQTLNSYELACLLLIMVFYYIRTYQFKLADTYLQFEKKLEINELGYTILESEANFLISVEIERKSVEANYMKIKSFYETGYSLVKQFLLRMEYLKTINPKEAYKIICSLEKEKLSPCVNQFYYTKCYILVKMNMYKECCDLIIDKKYITCNFIALFSLALSKMINNKEKNYYKNYLLRLIKDTVYLNEDNIHLAFIKLMQYEIDENTSAVICNYIKEQMLPALDKFQNTLYYEYVLKRYYLLVGELFRYKDAYQILGKFIGKDSISY